MSPREMRKINFKWKFWSILGAIGKRRIRKRQYMKLKFTNLDISRNFMQPYLEYIYISDNINSYVANFTHFELSWRWAIGQKENQKHFIEQRGIFGSPYILGELLPHLSGYIVPFCDIESFEAVPFWAPGPLLGKRVLFDPIQALFLVAMDLFQQPLKMSAFSACDFSWFFSHQVDRKSRT